MEGCPGEGEDETAGGLARFAREGGMRVRHGVHRLPVGAGDGGVKAGGIAEMLASPHYLKRKIGTVEEPTCLHRRLVGMYPSLATYHSAERER